MSEKPKDKINPIDLCNAPKKKRQMELFQMAVQEAQSYGISAREMKEIISYICE